MCISPRVRFPCESCCVVWDTMPQGSAAWITGKGRPSPVQTGSLSTPPLCTGTPSSGFKAWLSSASSMTLTFLCLNFVICKMGIGTYLPLWAVGKRKLAHIHQSLQQYLEHSEPTIKISHKYYLLSEVLLSGLPRWLSGKESACQCRRLEFYPWVRKIPWRRD